MKLEYKCDILTARALEDTIRATRKYTKGAFSRAQQHPIQGNSFPSRVLTEYYEVYPTLDLGWDMSATDAWAWVWGDIAHIDVVFLYNYRDNKAKVTIHGERGVVKALTTGIPGFHTAFERVKQNGVDNSKSTGGKKAVSSNTALQTTVEQV